MLGIRKFLKGKRLSRFLRVTSVYGRRRLGSVELRAGFAVGSQGPRNEAVVRRFS